MIGAGTSPRGRWHDDRGAQAVEFALILPVLLIVVLGIINFAYLFGQKLAINQAVREGARAAVVVGSGAGSTPLALVQDAANGSLISNTSTITSSAPTAGYVAACDGTTVGKNLQIRVQYPTSLLVSMYIPFTQNFTLNGEAVFRCEW